MELWKMKKEIRKGYSRYRARQFKEGKKPLSFRQWQELCADVLERRFPECVQ